MQRAIFFLLLGLLATGTATAQTGKIAGSVLDAETGDPLPGVNIVIEGTTQGTASDLDGNYIIIGVRPGQYTVMASFIGYTTQRVTGVGVNLDLTTRVDIRLSPEVIQGEEIIVTAEAEAVRKDVTSSEARVTADKLDRLPVTELGQVLDVQAGITTRGGGLHIRGGRSSEVVFMVDGVPVTDSYDGSTAVQLENDGIQELQVISGTFNAEFGNAMSGVINVVTKEGRSDRFGGSVQVYSGGYLASGSGGEDFLRGTNAEEFTRAGIEYRDVNPYSYLPVNPAHFYNATVSVEGPVVGDRVTFFGLGRFFNNDGWLYGARLFNTDGTAGDSALVPMNTFNKLSWQGNLRARLGRKMIVNLIGLGSTSEGRPYDFFRRWSPDGRSRFFDDGYDAKLKFTHLLSATTFYTVDVATFFREAESYLYEDAFDDRYNDFNLSPPDSVEIRPGEFSPVLTGFGRFARGGTDLGRFNRSTRTYLIKGDLSSQIGQHHLVKVGLQFKRDDLSFTGFGLQPAVDETGNRVEPFQTALPDPRSSAFNSFDGVQPLTVSAYAQDKVEFDNFIVNAGLRLDYFDARAQTPADPSDPNIFNPLKLTNRFRDTNGDGVITRDEEREDNALTVEDRQVYWYEDTEAKLQLSPRLGLAYPITDDGVIHFSFGLFFQIPTFNNLFDQFGYKIPALSGQYGPFGNPDLDAQKTTMYEIGFKQGFGDFVLDVTGYYRDVRSWVSTSTLIPTTLSGVNYVVYANRDYANTRGVTLSLSRNFQGNLGFDMSYTFQVVEGSNSNPAEEFFALQGNAQPKLALLPLDWDQRHKLAGAIYSGMGGWNGSLRFRVEDGFPYTPSFAQAALVGNDVQPEFPSNSRRMPSALEIDLNLAREFTLGRTRPRLFIEVYNLLDTRNVAAVYGDTGKPDVTLDQLKTGDFDPGFFVRPEHYREPRRMQVGLEFRF
jgi:hypothetical protein